LPRRPSHSPSRALREARTEGRTLVWRPTRSILTFRQVRRKRTSWEKPLRVLIARRRPTSRSWCSFLAKVDGQSVLRHGQSFARNSRFQRTLGGSARTGYLLFLLIIGLSPFRPPVGPPCASHGAYGGHGATDIPARDGRGYDAAGGALCSLTKPWPCFASTSSVTGILRWMIPTAKRTTSWPAPG
jgi:hypothetical protein